jgi:hypothetical protein
MHAVALRDALARRVEHAVVLDEHEPPAARRHCVLRLATRLTVVARMPAPKR